jgi:hypothetical protein
MFAFDFLSLPEDPELAFVEYEHRLREAMWRAIRDSQSVAYDNDRKVDYVTKIMAFHDAYNFSFLIRPNIDRTYDHFANVFDKFMDEVNYWTTQIQIRHAQRLRPISTILQFTPEIRQQLHSYISRIRETVTPITLPAQKKEAIFGKLNALANEIDCDRTKAEALTALVLEVASVGGQAAKELKPVRELADSIANLFAKAKDLGERLGLPAPSTPKRIEGPKQSPKPAELLDDEIPF